jgi:hypothetical protein
MQIKPQLQHSGTCRKLNICYLFVSGTLHVLSVDLQDAVTAEDAGCLGGPARQDRGDVLQWGVQLSIDRLQVPALAYLTAHIEPETCMKVRPLNCMCNFSFKK